MEAAARNYAADPNAGCFILEGLRCSDPQAREAARAESLTAENAVCSYIATHYPEKAASLTDFISTSMVSPSDQVLNGHDLDRLLATARLAATTLAEVLRA